MKNELLTAVETLNIDKKFAVGNDLVYIPGFKNSFTSAFKQKVYTATEVTYCDLFDDALLRYASTWAAKEAVYKALKQIDPTPLSWQYLEITRDKIAGKPTVILHDNPDKYRISLTISHDGDYAWAVALIQIGLS